MVKSWVVEGRWGGKGNKGDKGIRAIGLDSGMVERCARQAGEGFRVRLTYKPGWCEVNALVI